MTKAQEVYEKVEAKVPRVPRRQMPSRVGRRRVGATVQLHERRLLRAHPHARRNARATTQGRDNGDPIEQALGLLSRALESIDTEVADAKERADDAKADYEQLRDTAKERKAAIQAKIDALKA